MQPSAVTSPRVMQSTVIHLMNMKKEYFDLFAERKWKLAFDAMPLNIPKAVSVESLSDLPIIRVRASEFNKENDAKRVSVSVDYVSKQAIVKVTKK